jgi:hypothetical protein
MSEFDQRQYRLMLDDLSAFEGGKLSVDKLIADLEGLANVLEEKNIDWRQSFFRHWGHLEEAWAVALDRGATSLDEQEAKVALSAAGKLKSMVLERIGNVADRHTTDPTE